MQIKYVENNFSLSYAHLDWGFTKIKGFKRIYKLYILKTVIDTFFKFLIFSPCINEKTNLGGEGALAATLAWEDAQNLKTTASSFVLHPLVRIQVYKNPREGGGRRGGIYQGCVAPLALLLCICLKPGVGAKKWHFLNFYFLVWMKSIKWRQLY